VLQNHRRGGERYPAQRVAGSPAPCFARRRSNRPDSTTPAPRPQRAAQGSGAPAASAARWTAVRPAARARRAPPHPPFCDPRGTAGPIAGSPAGRKIRRAAPPDVSLRGDLGKTQRLTSLRTEISAKHSAGRVSARRSRRNAAPDVSPHGDLGETQRRTSLREKNLAKRNAASPAVPPSRSYEPPAVPLYHPPGATNRQPPRCTVGAARPTARRRAVYRSRRDPSFSGWPGGPFAE
jgi:hypothetical protein